LPVAPPTLSKEFMKPFFLKPSAISPLIILFWVLVSCHKNSEAPRDSCKLTQQVYSSADGSSTSTQNYEYNSTGLLTGITYVGITKDKSGIEIGNGSGSTSYQYDADGFIVKAISQSQGNSKEDGQRSSSSSTEYQYQNGRLIKESYSSSSTFKGKTEKYALINVYGYDSEGNNIKISRSSTSNGTSYTYDILYEWKDKKLAKITYAYPGSAPFVPFFDVNSKGWITKYIEQSLREQRYSYDSEGNMLRKEDWYDGKKVQVTVNEYDTYKNVYKFFFPVVKGKPVNEFYGNAPATHNNTKYIVYSVDNTGQEILRSSSSNTYQYNSAGYPISEVSTQGSIDYTYKDCQ
jgi:YD repeat-containing protein